MCWCFKSVISFAFGYTPKYKEILNIIPEFIPETFIPGYERQVDPGLLFWWDVNYVNPRIEAFDKLLELYANDSRELLVNKLE